MIRCVLGLLTVVTVLDCYGADFLDRTWTTHSGSFTERARLVSVDISHISLETLQGKQQRIQISDLAEEDRQIALALLQCEQNSETAAKVSQHAGQFRTSPAAIAELFDVMHDQAEKDFVAGFYAGMLNAFSRDSDRLQTSKRELAQTVARLKAINAVLPNAHGLTLASAMNNLAIVSLREGNVKRAVSLLADASQSVETMPIAVYHNATLMIEVAINAGKQSKLSDGDRKRLAKIVAGSSPEATQYKFPQRFMYTLAHDPFVSPLLPNSEHRASGEAAHSTDGSPESDSGMAEQGPLRPGSQHLWSGSGFLVSPSLVLTNRHVVEGDASDLQFLLMNDTAFRGGALAVPIAVSEDEDIDVAVLQLVKPNTKAKPIPLRTDLAKVGEELLVIGYPASEVYEGALNTSRGIVNSIIKNEKHIIHDAVANHGNSGCPCLDENGNAIGVLTGGFRPEDAKGRYFAISIPAAIGLLRRGKDFDVLPIRDTPLSGVDVVGLVKDAVVYIEAHGSPNKLGRKLPQTEGRGGKAGFEQLASLGLFPELTCFDCKGSGVRSCAACTGGTVSERRRVPTFQDPASGRQFFGTKVFRVACPACSGRGGFPCTDRC